MEIDTIKDLWNAENPAETPEISMEKQKEIRMPLEKIRKNMRMEFWVTVITVVAIIPVFPLLFKIVQNDKFVFYFISFLLSFVIIISFYFSKFFRLYRDLEIMELGTKDSLKDLIWKFKLNEQYYLSYYIATVPVLLFEFALFMDYIPGLKSLVGMKFTITFLSLVFSSLFVLYFFGKVWFRTYYGKYIYQIKKALQIIEIHENAVK